MCRNTVKRYYFVDILVCFANLTIANFLRHFGTAWHSLEYALLSSKSLCNLCMNCFDIKLNEVYCNIIGNMSIYYYMFSSSVCRRGHYCLWCHKWFAAMATHSRLRWRSGSTDPVLLWFSCAGTVEWKLFIFLLLNGK